MVLRKSNDCTGSSMAKCSNLNQVLNRLWFWNCFMASKCSQGYNNFATTTSSNKKLLVRQFQIVGEQLNLLHFRKPAETKHYPHFLGHKSSDLKEFFEKWLKISHFFLKLKVTYIWFNNQSISWKLVVVA